MNIRFSIFSKTVKRGFSGLVFAGLLWFDIYRVVTEMHVCMLSCTVYVLYCCCIIKEESEDCVFADN